MEIEMSKQGQTAIPPLTGPSPAIEAPETAALARLSQSLEGAVKSLGFTLPEVEAYVRGELSGSELSGSELCRADLSRADLSRGGDAAPKG